MCPPQAVLQRVVREEPRPPRSLESTVPIDLAIFTEGNYFPALLGGEIVGPFRVWAQTQPRYAALPLENIVVVTLPAPTIVQVLLGHGIAFGNMTL